jgi:hypothetical protein
MAEIGRSADHPRPNCGFLPTSETSSGVVAGAVSRSYDDDFRVKGVSVRRARLARRCSVAAADRASSRRSDHAVPEVWP